MGRLKLFKGEYGVMIKGIAKRWLFNSLSLMLVIICVLIVSAAIIIQNYYYNGIEQVLRGNATNVPGYFLGHSTTSDQFISTARTYVDTFQNKELMEVSVYDYNDECLLTSTGFGTNTSKPNPDYDAAKSSPGGFGRWTGRIYSEERVMAVTQAVYNPFGDYMGSIRYVVSLTQADRTIIVLIAIIALLGIAVAVVTVISNAYFIKSITQPLAQIGATAKKIAGGDFNARIENPGNDEVGELCDTINYMVAELETSEKMKIDFISSISHELRTPLTAIKGWAETMKLSGGFDKETMNRGMDIIVHESERLSGIVEELLDFSKMQNKAMIYMPEKIDILAELDEAVYLYKERAISERKHLVFEEPESLSPVMADKNRMKQVFVNIIDNALKYTPEGGTVSITVEENETNIYVIISDNGCGIPTEHLPRIKEKFYKANQTKGGSGIGLAIANEIVLLHSGSLRIESEDGKGTTVVISIPHIKSEA